MGQTGKPSRGCAVCRRRRIKCDERDPECSYCIKSKQKCPGYKDAFDLAWRDQTAIARNSVERRKALLKKDRERPRVGAVAQVEPLALSEVLDPSQPTHTTSPCRSVAEYPNEYALDFYFQVYVLSGSGNFARVGLHMAGMFSAAESRPVLRSSTIAIAGCLLSAWLGRRPDNSLSRSFYTKAVTLMQDRVAKKMVNDDEILMSVLLLQLYERMAGTSREQSPTKIHLDGALALIRYRGMKSFRSLASRDIVFEVRNQLIDIAFHEHALLPADVTAWSEDFADLELTPLARLDNINVQLVNLSALVATYASDELHAIHTTKEASIKKSSSRVDIRPFLSEIQSIENQLIAWSSNLDPKWYPFEVSGIECIAQSIPLYENRVLLYPSVHVAMVWNRYRVSRIRTQVLAEKLRARTPSPVSSREDATPLFQSPFVDTPLSTITASGTDTLIQALADEVCATVPFYLGSRMEPGRVGDRTVEYPHLPGRGVSDTHYQAAPAMGGWQLLAPLQHLVAYQGTLREGQKGWILGQLQRVTDIYGFGSWKK